MPGGDRTGPEGYGPRTGRGLGYCSGYMTAQDSQKEHLEVGALAEAGVEVLDVDSGDAAEDFGVEIITQIPTMDQLHITETFTLNPARTRRNPTLKIWSKV